MIKFHCVNMPKFYNALHDKLISAKKNIMTVLVTS